MTHCTWPTPGRRGHQECGHRVVWRWRRAGEDDLPRCRRHVSDVARARATDEGYELVPA